MGKPNQKGIEQSYRSRGNDEVWADYGRSQELRNTWDEKGSFAENLGRRLGESARNIFGGYEHDFPRESKNYFGKGPKGWRRSDERIRDDVCEALYRSYEVDASNIEVKVENGIVSLKGFVDDRSTKRLAENVVENLSGVEDVRNELHIRREGEEQPSAPH